ncbi:thymidylate kinase [Candidatus Woesearchaeota archaeon]|nr:thymidylate kinase [Candidatus Woesearchaeota archaeon]
MRGRLIVIEGTDGSGKATQAERLVERLAKEGRSVAMFDFPQYYDTFFGRMVGRYLAGEFGTADEVSPYLASLLYAGDRWQAKERILAALAAGKVVVCNRYASANMGHQSGKIGDPAKRKAFLDWLKELEYQVYGIPLPNATVFLYVPYAVGQTLVDRKGARGYVGGAKRDIHESDGRHLKDAEESYLALAAEEGWIRVDCMRDGKLMGKDEIHAIVWEKVGPLI